MCQWLCNECSIKVTAVLGVSQPQLPSHKFILRAVQFKNLPKGGKEDVYFHF